MIVAILQSREPVKEAIAVEIRLLIEGVLPGDMPALGEIIGDSLREFADRTNRDEPIIAFKIDSELVPH